MKKFLYVGSILVLLTIMGLFVLVNIRNTAHISDLEKKLNAVNRDKHKSETIGNISISKPPANSSTEGHWCGDEWHNEPHKVNINLDINGRDTGKSIISQDVKGLIPINHSNPILLTDEQIRNIEAGQQERKQSFDDHSIITQYYYDEEQYHKKFSKLIEESKSVEDEFESIKKIFENLDSLSDTEKQSYVSKFKLLLEKSKSNQVNMENLRFQKPIRPDNVIKRYSEYSQRKSSQ